MKMQVLQKMAGGAISLMKEHWEAAIESRKHWKEEVVQHYQHRIYGILCRCGLNRENLTPTCLRDIRAHDICVQDCQGCSRAAN